jgi:hypothetical protein
MEPMIVIAVIIGLVVIAVVILMRDRLSELFFDSQQGRAGIKAHPPQEDDKPVSVKFSGNKLRGEMRYRSHGDAIEFAGNDVDGKHDIEQTSGTPSADRDQES